ncbi:MAG: PSP1 C-terminal domain-containing protein [Pirellulales bacterium]|nr:PSP1 C-terminal domain-containing protein [Pirellulales bacterium]
MSRFHYLRVGNLGHVGRFTAVDAVSYPRGSRVIARTRRGLEVAEVLAPAPDLFTAHSGESATGHGSDGSILRGVTVEDELLIARLERRKLTAIAECENLLRQEQLDATLMDVEVLFDGSAIYFHFLGDVPASVADLTEKLAVQYDTVAQLTQFGETLAAGCGPDCGTEAAAGHGGCASCATGCAIASACDTRRAK